MDEITLQTPILIKLGSFAGKMKYCLIDTYFLPLLKYLHLTIESHGKQLFVMATDRQLKNNQDDKCVALHELIWEDFHQCSIPTDSRVFHRNGIPMDNRVENLFLLPKTSSYDVNRSLIPLSFYWRIISFLPVEMDEIDFHQSSLESNSSSLYECHNAPCTNLISSSTEQFQCFLCQRIRYCSAICQSLDADIHSVFCHSN